MIFYFVYTSVLCYSISLYLYIFRTKRTTIKASVFGKGKGVPKSAKPSPITMPKTPSVAAPSKSSSTAPSRKTSTDEIIDLEEQEEVRNKVMVEGAGTAADRMGVDDSDKNMAEAPADDAIAKAESSQQQATDEHESNVDKLLREDRARSYAVLDVLMAEVWPEDDPEFIALDKF